MPLVQANICIAQAAREQLVLRRRRELRFDSRKKSRADPISLEVWMYDEAADVANACGDRCANGTDDQIGTYRLQDYGNRKLLD